MLKEIVEHLAKEGVKVVDFYPERNDLITTEHSIAQRKVFVSGLITDKFPYKAPAFYLEKRISFGSLAHVGWEPQTQFEHDVGDICYGNKDTFCTDASRPVEVYIQSLNKALDVLQNSLSNPDWNVDELNSEFMSVWAFHCLPPKIFLLANAEQLIQEVDVFYPHTKKHGYEGRPIATSTTSEVKENFELSSSLKNLKLRKKIGRGLTFKVSKLPPPPAPHSSILTWWEDLLTLLNSEERSALMEFKNCRGKHLYLFIYTEIKNDPVWVGVEFFTEVKSKLPLTQNSITNWQAKAFSVSPINREVLIPRSSGSSQLSNKHACIIGCGSVGSQIARLLASSGIGKITLFDGDSLEVENLHKHALPARLLGFNKALSMKVEIERNFPFVEVSKNEIDFNLNESGDLDKYDIIISATGFLSFDLALDKNVRSQSDVPLLFAWNEPFGIGGHVLVNQSFSKGCLNCTFVDLNSSIPSLERNWLHFIEPGQSTLEKIGGCGFDFIAFSAVDAMKTATLATEMVIDVLEGNLITSAAKSWVGNLKKAKDRNIELSHRYQRAIRTKHYLLENDIYTDGCPNCS